MYLYLAASPQHFVLCMHSALHMARAELAHGFDGRCPVSRTAKASSEPPILSVYRTHCHVVRQG